MIERVDNMRWFCSICSHDWAAGTRRFVSLDDLVARTGLRRDEVVTLADIGALNAFGYDRRSALWQAERAVRPSGELFTTINAETAELAEFEENTRDQPAAEAESLGSRPREVVSARGGGAPREVKKDDECPL